MNLHSANSNQVLFASRNWKDLLKGKTGMFYLLDTLPNYKKCVFLIDFSDQDLQPRDMGHFLKVVCILFASGCLSLADNVQGVIESVTTLDDTVTDDRKFIAGLEDVVGRLTDEETQFISKSKLPPMENFHKKTEENLTAWINITFLKILLLTLQEEILEAEKLLVKLDFRLDLAENRTNGTVRLAILLRCIMTKGDISDKELQKIYVREQRLYKEE